MAQNGVTVSNLAVSPGTVTFDVSWKKPMPAVWSDSVWVFVDYNDAGAMKRLPLITTGATLTETSAPGVGKVIVAPGNNSGVWVFGNARSAISGSFSATVKLLSTGDSESRPLHGACAYASNYPPVGDYISATNIAFTGTPPYEIVLADEGGSTISQPSNGNYLVPEGYTLQSFSDKTGAPGVLKCKPMTGTIDFSIVPATVAKAQPVSFEVSMAPTDPVVSSVTYSWSAASFVPSSYTGTQFNTTAPADPKTYRVTLTVRSTGYCDLAKTKDVPVIDCISPATFALQASASSFCADDAVGVTFSLPGTEPGRGYQLYRGATPVSLLLIGTGSAATFSGGPFNVAGVYTAVSVADGMYCAVSMGAARTVVTIPLPSAPVISQPADVCYNGDNLVFTITGYTGTPAWTSTGDGVVSGLSVNFVNPSTGTKTVKARTSQTYTGALTCYSPEATRSATVHPLPAVSSVAGGQRCGTGTVDLSALPSSGTVIDWYSAATGGTLLSSANNNYTTPSISTSRTYYVQARNSTTNCVSASRMAVLATVNAIPAAPAGASSNARCGSGAVTFSATAPDGCTIDWYTTSTGTTLVSGGGSVTSFSPAISTSTTYYAQARNTTTGCISATRTAVTGTVNALPAVPAMGGGGSQCGGTLNITATPGSGGTGIRWTDNNSTSQSRSVSASGTYYAVTTVSGCESGTASVSVTIASTPGAPTMGGGGNQCGGSRTITATPGSNGTGIRWTDNNSTSQSRSVTATGTYYAVTTSALCGESGTASVAVNFTSAPGVPTMGGGGSQCSGNRTITATPGSGGTGIRWTDNNSTSQSRSVTATGTYYAVTTSTSCGESGSAGVSVTITPTPAQPTLSHDGPKAKGSTLTFTASGCVGACNWGGNFSGSGSTKSATAVGTYTAQVRSNNSGCYSAYTASQTSYILESPYYPCTSSDWATNPVLTLTSTDVSTTCQLYDCANAMLRIVATYMDDGAPTCTQRGAPTVIFERCLDAPCSTTGNALTCGYPPALRFCQY